MSKQQSVLKQGSSSSKIQKKVKSVPFVELYGGRLQGVVSSGSDPNRVYVNYITAGDPNHFYCSTNNDRICSGLYSRPCGHIHEMFDVAALKFGIARVASYLGVEGDLSTLTTSGSVIGRLKCSMQREPAGMVFSRFLNYLRYVELKGSTQPIPEMHWFIAG
jgi:hypothetical protein